LFISKCISNKDISYNSFAAEQICIELIQKEKLLSVCVCVCVCAHTCACAHMYTHTHTHMDFKYNDVYK